MKDGYVMKVNLCSISERDRTEDCSLEAVKESFRIGKDKDQRRGQSRSRKPGRKIEV